MPSIIIKSIVSFSALTMLSGCFLRDPRPEEVVIVQPAPVTVQPSVGKF